jgi:hypothetical protein
MDVVPADWKPISDLDKIVMDYCGLFLPFSSDFSNFDTLQMVDQKITKMLLLNWR